MECTETYYIDLQCRYDLGNDTGGGTDIPDFPSENENNSDERKPDGESDGSGFTPPIIEPLEIINELTGKAKCIYDKLNQNGTSFAEVIKKFDGEFPVAHLRFSMADLANGTRGRTLPPKNYMIEIQLNNDQSNSGVSYRPNLLIAKTIMHEVIHAEMWRKILSIIDNGGDVGGMTKQEWTNKLSNGDYLGFFDYYSRYGINEFQHPQIATHYRDVIADALQEFDNYAHSRQFYLDIAWEGLRYSNISTWADLPQSEKDRINNVISTYISNNSNQSCE